MNLPNKITLSRLVLAVAFFALISFDDPVSLDVGLVVFVAACLTDLLDGYVARKWGQETALGRIADPLVDKVIVCGGFALLAHRAPVLHPWMLVVIISREFLVSSIRAYAESRGIAFGARWSGKAKAATQMVALALVIYLKAHGDLPLLSAGAAATITTIVVYLAIALTAYSGGVYVGAARRALARGD
ncbi:MAG: CDP-diacylglycerol--glycerol-3-phosphate 3-phosphatidyltransferase [Planctomycetota bacterium]